MVGRRPRLLASLALPPVARAIVDDCLALIDAIDPIVARLERDLRARVKPDPRVTVWGTETRIRVVTRRSIDF